MDGLVRKLEKDKYFVVVKAKNIAIMQSKKFSLLDDVKNVKIGNERTATISIGFGMGSDSYVQNYTSATAATIWHLAEVVTRQYKRWCKDILLWR